MAWIKRPLTLADYLTRDRNYDAAVLLGMFFFFLSFVVWSTYTIYDSSLTIGRIGEKLGAPWTNQESWQVCIYPNTPG